MTQSATPPAAPPPAPPPHEPGRHFWQKGALGYPTFRLYLAGNFFSSSGLWLRSVVQGWLVVELTNSASWLGLISFLSAFPTLLLTPLGGALADRWDRRILLMVSNSCLAFTFLLMGIFTSVDMMTIGLLAILVTVTSLLYAFDQPPRQALIPNLVEPRDTVSAIAIQSANFSIARVAGPAAGGIIVPVLGIATGFYAVTAGYLVFVGVLLFIRQRRASPRIAGNMLVQLKDGFAYAGRHRTVRGLLLMSLVMNLFGSPLLYLLPQFVRDRLGGDATDLGLLLASAGGAAFLAAVILAIIPKEHANGRLSLWMGLIATGLTVAFCFTTSLIPALILTVAFNLTAQFYYTLNNSLLQITASEEMRGRVMSVFTLTWSASALGALIVGALADVIGIDIAIAAWTAVTIPLMVLIQWWLPEVKQVGQIMPEATRPAGSQAGG